MERSVLFNYAHTFAIITLTSQGLTENSNPDANHYYAIFFMKMMEGTMRPYKSLQSL